MEKYYFVTTCVMFAVIGLCVGSFLNVVVYRLPLGMNLAKPDSHCPNCKNHIAWYDNIPILSYLILRGKCRHCKLPISPRYIFVEFINGMLWLASVFAFYEKGIWYIIACALFLSILLTMSLCDLENLFIPDTLQIALAIVAIGAIFADNIGYEQKLIGLAVGGGFFLIFYFLAFIMFGREGLGFGDVKLMAGVGLFLGWKNVIVGVIISVFSALVIIAISKLFFNKKTDMQGMSDGSSEEIPFGPFLAFGATIALFFGNTIIDMYLSLIF